MRNAFWRLCRWWWGAHARCPRCDALTDKNYRLLMCSACYDVLLRMDGEKRREDLMRSQAFIEATIDQLLAEVSNGR